MNDPKNLTITHAQIHQPWTVPYSVGVNRAASHMPQVLANHCALHASKSLGKICTVLEGLDHRDAVVTDEERCAIAAASADLFTAAMRFANLYDFDLATVLVERVAEKNGCTYPNW